MATNLTPEQLAEFTSYLTPETLNQIYGGLADPTLPGGIRANLGYEWDSMEAQVAGGPGRATLTGYSGPIGADDMYNAYSPTGEFLGRYQADNDDWKALLPIVLAVGGQFLFGGGLGGAGAAGAEALGSGAWLGEGIASGVPAWDAAALSAGNTLAGVSPALLDAQFIAADAAQLAAQTGNNVAAIQQNLIAAGVDPIVAATAADAAALGLTGSELITTISGAGQAGSGLFTGGSAADLALGGISTVTGAPAGSSIPGVPTTGGVPTGGGGGTTTTPGGLPPGVTTTLTNLLKNPGNLAGLLGLLGGGGGAPMGVGSIPTQGMPTNSPEYFNQVQGFLNQYLPGQMPTQSQYLSSWYNNTPGSYMPSAAAPSGGGGMLNPPAPTPAAAALPPQRADVVTTGGGKPGRNREGRGNTRQQQEIMSAPTTATPEVDPVAEALAARGITSPDWMNVSLRDLVEKSGYSVSDKAALDRAQMALYGNVGANMDTRDWAAIMASDNPLAAAEAALARMYSDPNFRSQNAEWLASQGFSQVAAPLTYAQMVGRTGASYTPTAAEAAMIAQEINKITSAAGGGYHQAELAGPAQVLANAGYAVDPGYKPYLNQPLQTAQPVNYGGLSAQSSASDIAQAYKQFTGGAAGDTVESRNAAIQYLQNIGIDPSRIGEAYSLFKA